MRLRPTEGGAHGRGSLGVSSLRHWARRSARPRRESRPLTGDAARRQAALRSAALIVGFLAIAVAARRLGAPDVACGVALTTAFLLALARLLALELRLLGPVRSVGWSTGLLLASLLPVMASVHPGALLADGSLGHPGDALELGPGAPRQVLLAVAAEVEEGSSFAYRLVAGRSVQVVTVLRQSFRTAPGAPSAHWHEDRPSVLLEVNLEPGVHSIQLDGTPGDGPPLHVRAYSRWIHPALPPACTFLALTALLLVLGRVKATRRAVHLASMIVSAGLAAGLVATPDHAMRASLAGIAASFVIGVPAGSVLDWLAQAVRRLGFRNGSEVRPSELSKRVRI